MRDASARLCLAVMLVWPAGEAVATTANDLSARVVVDGVSGEYDPDEIILGVATNPPESTRDSRWGSDNDIGRVAVTWDRAFLYIAVDATLADSDLLLLIDGGPGGEGDLRWLGDVARNVVVTGWEPDLMILAGRGDARARLISLADGAVSRLSADAFPTRIRVAGDGYAALEAAIPWDRLGVPESVSIVAAVTGAGRGAGDAAPDPGRALPEEATDRALLDRRAVITVDVDADSVPDAGISPNAATSVEPDAVRAGDTDLELIVEPRAFAPDRGETATFFPRRVGPDPQGSVFVTCRIFDLAGNLVRVLYDNEARAFDDASVTTTEADRWDGTDRAGNIVPGGVYVANLTWSSSRGGRDGRANVPVVVVR